MNKLRPALKGLVYILVVLVMAASFLPLSHWNNWWIRLLDFPRLQISVMTLAILGGLLLLFSKRNPADYAAILGLLAILGYDGWKLVTYTPVHGVMAVKMEPDAPGTRFRVVSANVQMTNHDPADLIQIVRRARPDIFLAVETNERWNRPLSVLTNQMPYQVQHITSNYFGMNLFSRFPLLHSSIRFFSDENVPAILTDIRLPGGGLVRFFGIHPRPPRLGQSSDDRDAQLMSAAFAAREDGPPVVLAGDLNAVPWERTTRRLLRLGRLLDPRVGRAYLATYNAQNRVESWPLDHILFQDRIGLVRLEALPAFGSDHHPILADLALAPELATQQSAPRARSNDRAQALRAIQRGRSPETLSRAMQRPSAGANVSDPRDGSR